MGLFDWIQEKVISPVTKFAKEKVIDPVSNFAKPIINVGKKILRYVPGGEMVTDAIESIGDFINTAKEDAKKVGENAEKNGIQLKETYDDAQTRVRKNIERGKTTYEGIKKKGKDFLTKVKNPDEWKKKVIGAL